MNSPGKCILITYPDTLGADLAELRTVMKSYFADVFDGIHLLPYYPSSADRGFAPITYREVDSRFGTWNDIELLSADFALIVDFMINHISRRSAYFRDVIENGTKSRHASMFIPFDGFWPSGKPTKDDIARIYKRKPRPPFTVAELGDGTRKRFWCTFDDEQIDIDVFSPTGQEFIRASLDFLCRMGATVIRLDAVAYTTKKPGTQCFFEEPEIWRILEFAGEVCSRHGVLILPEVHEHYRYQLELSRRGYTVYDFALPMLVLQTIYDADSRYLKRWLVDCPRNQYTTLDTHDGIGIVDVKDLMPDDIIERTKRNLYTYGANIKPVYSSEEYHNLDVYQLNCTYYSALGNDDARYLIARAIQLFAPGIPQIYYVGLLAGENDIELAEKSGVGRDINRHGYSLEEIEHEVSRPVVGRLIEMLRLRNAHPAFGGSVRICDSEDTVLIIERLNGDHKATLTVDLEQMDYEIDVSPL